MLFGGGGGRRGGWLLLCRCLDTVGCVSWMGLCFRGGGAEEGDERGGRGVD
jgi:hypothetical protein